MNYWHMQLHPNDKDGVDFNGILKILEDYKVIGMGESWENDKDQPKVFKEEMQFGDIVIVRHKNKKVVAIVEVISEAYSITDEENQNIMWNSNANWFRLRRKIRIIDKNPNYINLDDCKPFYAITLHPLNITDEMKIIIKDKIIDFYQKREEEFIKIIGI